MSKGPVFTGKTCTEITQYGYVNLPFSEKDWCTYRGNCDKEHIVHHDDICLYCQYRKDLNIPAMIVAKMKEKYNEGSKV